MFVGRDKELEFLNDEYNKKESSFVVIYGRRRIGKTTLISEFAKDKDLIYFLASEESEDENKRKLCEKINENINHKGISYTESWYDIFDYLMEMKKGKRFVLVIDEFQYLGKIVPAFPSIFQSIWDENLKDKNVMVIICGSLIHMLQSQVLNYSSPLYGRRTGQIRLKQISFFEFQEFFKNSNLSKKELIERYAITGGVPKYIETLSGKGDIYSLINKFILDNNSYLYEEPYFLLQNEVYEVGTYFTIIKAIAMGNTKIGKIADALRVNQANITRYLQVLVNLDILKREVPVTEINPEKSKRGQYYIKDNYINFWFKFVYQNKDLLEFGNKKEVLEKIKKNFIDNHVAYVYEDVCRQELIDMIGKGKVKSNVGRIGKWWNNNEEIDIVGIDTDGDEIIFGECKYTTKKMDVDVFYDLKRKASLVDWNNMTRKERYILFSINGYTDRLIDLAKSREDIILAEE